MHDPDFDDDPPKKREQLTLIPPVRVVPFRSLLGKIRLRWPIPGLAQAVFAEAFRQCLLARLPVDRAVRLAAEVNPCPRFRKALERMAVHVRSGYPLEASLAKTEVIVRPGLRAALRVGEEHGCLVEELSVFARRTAGFDPRKYHRAIGRSPEAVAFAASLARLLRDHRLTVQVIRSAGEGKGQFSRVSEEIAQKVEDGSPFMHALRKHSTHFDALYLGLLETASSREEMRACLGRLGADV